jgi:hypothetical protein
MANRPGAVRINQTRELCSPLIAAFPPCAATTSDGSPWQPKLVVASRYGSARQRAFHPRGALGHYNIVLRHRGGFSRRVASLQLTRRVPARRWLARLSRAGHDPYSDPHLRRNPRPRRSPFAAPPIRKLGGPPPPGALGSTVSCTGKFQLRRSCRWPWSPDLHAQYLPLRNCVSGGRSTFNFGFQD